MLEAEKVDSEFERLNNAIVRAALRGEGWSKLNDAWQDEVVEERNWKIAIPPLWASLLESYWSQYAALYSATKDKVSLANPKDIAPSGIAAAVRELYAPTAQATEQARQAAAVAIDTVKQAAMAKVQQVAAQVGAAAAQGAKKELEPNWIPWAVGAGALMWYLVFRR